MLFRGNLGARQATDNPKQMRKFVDDGFGETTSQGVRMNFSRISILFAFVTLTACAPWPLEVTPSLSGVVLDRSTREPIVGAKVRVAEFPESVVTTSGDGSFLIRPIRKWQIFMIGTDSRPGYRITAEASGFLAAGQNWDVGDDRPLIVTLQRLNEK